MFLKTDFSILSSSIKLQNGVEELKKKGFKVGILSDTRLFGALEFFYACKKADIMPIIGTEFKEWNLEVPVKKKGAKKEPEPIMKEIGAKYLLVAKNGNGFKALSKITATGKIEKSKDIFKVLIDFDNVEDLKDIQVVLK